MVRHMSIAVVIQDSFGTPLLSTIRFYLTRYFKGFIDVKEPKNFISNDDDIHSFYDFSNEQYSNSISRRGSSSCFIHLSGDAVMASSVLGWAG